jgi:hypothetical protein
MMAIELHEYVKRSVQDVIKPRYERGFRHLLESGGCEGFLRDLLAMALTAADHALIRERPLVHGSADLVLVQSGFCIEAKQLHLKDGTADLIQLKQSGLSDAVIGAMVKSSVAK